MTAEIIISTASDFKDNMNLVMMLKSKREKPVIFVVAQTPREGVDLKDAGADYIIIPHKINGNNIGDIIQVLYSVKPIHLKRKTKTYSRHSHDKWDYEKYLLKDILKANELKIADIRNQISKKLK